MAKFTPPKIVKDSEAQAEEKPPSIDKPKSPGNEEAKFRSVKTSMKPLSSSPT